MTRSDRWKQFRQKLVDYSTVLRNVSISVAAAAVVAALAAGYFWAKRSPLLPLVNAANVQEYCGWAGPEAAKEAYEEVKGELPEFRILADQPQDNAGKRVVLWDAAKSVNGGKHVQFQQLVGDCVGAGGKHALDYLQCVALAAGARQGEFRPVFEPFHYACARMSPDLGNGRFSRDKKEPWSGCTGVCQAMAFKKYGAIPEDLPGLPAYSLETIKKWAVRMPGQEWLDEGRLHLVETVAMVTSAEEVRDAICNGYPVTIASDWGGQFDPPVVDGRLVNRRVTRWGHQMCVVGYDGLTGKEPYWFILNSWDPLSFPAPPDDSPRGGFWVRQRDVEYIVGQRDSWAISNFPGFPSQEWIIIRENIRRQGVPAPSDN